MRCCCRCCRRRYCPGPCQRRPSRKTLLWALRSLLPLAVRLLPAAQRLLPASPSPFGGLGAGGPSLGPAAAWRARGAAVRVRPGSGQPCRAFGFALISTPSFPEIWLLLGCCRGISPQEAVRGWAQQPWPGRGVLRRAPCPWLAPCPVSLLLLFAAKGVVFEITRECCLQEMGKETRPGGREPPSPAEQGSR